MKTEWKKVKLGDIATFSNGINFGKESYKAGVKLIGVSNFGNRFFPDYDELEEVDENVLRPNDYLKNGDIVFVRSNGNKELVGRCMLIQNPPSTVTYSGFCIRARLNNIDENYPRFFAYYFKSKDFRKAMSNTAVGANIQNLNQGLLSNHIFYLPPLETQQKIAGILSAYDDLIENNRKQIKLLEEAAQKLYKEWFVKLNFPGHENVKMVDGVPDGWKKGILSEIAIDSGKTVSKQERNNFKYYLPIDCLPKKSLVYTTFNSVELAESSLASFSKGDIIFGAMRPYFHKVVIARDLGLTRNTCFVINSSMQELYAYLVMLLFSEETINYATKISVGTTMPYVRWSDFQKMPIIIPSNNTLICFSKVVIPYFDKMNALAKQVLQLQSARDKFLPKLMSGEFI